MSAPYVENVFPLNHIQTYSSDDYSILKPYPVSTPKQSLLLQFDSKFEGGNLAHAFYNLRTLEYELVMQDDTNTLGYNQWFYFYVTGMRRGASYTFNVINYVRVEIYRVDKEQQFVSTGHVTRSLLLHV